MLVQDLAAPNKEDLSDFQHLHWYKALVDDSHYTPILIRAPACDAWRSFFWRTLSTPSTIHACQAFYRGPLPALRYSKPRPAQQKAGLGEVKIVFSLGGNGLDGYAGYAHGGLTATLFDEGLSVPVYVQEAFGAPTKEMTIEYKRPVPTPGVVLFMSWVEKVEGRRWWVKGRLEDANGNILATGRCVCMSLKERL